MIALLLLLATQDAPATEPSPVPETATPMATTETAPAPTPAPAAAPAVVVNEKPKILVLDFRDDGVGTSAVRIIHDTLVSHVSKDARLDVLSSEDVRRAVAREAERREATNCDEEGCIAEIAEALGAQLTIYGTAGKLGDLVVVNVNLYDARNARSVGRETIEIGSLEALPGPLRRAGDKLIAQLFGEPVNEGPAFGPLFWTGTAVASVGAIATIVGGSVYIGGLGAVGDATSFADKTSAKAAQDAGLNLAVAGLGALGVGAAVLIAALAIE
jgi:hypothetical protein